MKKLIYYLANKECRLIITLMYLFACPAFAQTFRAETKIPDVGEDGFYKIRITPEMSVFLNNRFSDIRIFDQTNKEVSFLFQPEPISYSTREFRAYKIIDKKQIKGSHTSLILENTERKSINNLSLLIKNAEVRKRATLLGSDDREQWFALKQHFTISAINNTSETFEVRIVDFPLSNYSYYELQIDDSSTAPLNILNAGYYALSTMNASYTEVPVNVQVVAHPPGNLRRTANERKKSTFLSISFDTARVVDKLELSMQGAPYFLRTGYLYIEREFKNRKGKTEKYDHLLESFEVSSSSPSVVYLPEEKAGKLWIEIDNGDNPALEVASAKAWLRDRYLTAYLQKGNSYTVKLGNGALVEPRYDLAFFRDSIPADIPLINMGTIQDLTVADSKPSKTFFTNKQIIWVAIVLVIGVLGFMSIRMIRENAR